MNGKAIAYYRVSTQKQGQSGLGLEAQEHAVKSYAAANGLTIISPPGEYTEIETGTNKRQRPKLQAAIAAAKENDAVLLIAKLDRLARNVHFITGLQESGVKFVACDMPQANDTQVQFMAIMAEWEAKLISERTRAALQAAKARGVKLGREPGQAWGRKDENGEFVPMPETQQAGPAALKQSAVDAYSDITGYVMTLRDELKMSYRAIADRLNSENKRTRRGKEFKAMTVKRIVARA